MWIKDFTWNTDCTNISTHHLARCIAINQWNFPSLRITCLLILILASFQYLQEPIAVDQSHGRRPCALKMQRKCYIGEALAQRSINLLPRSAEKQQTDQLLYKAAIKTQSQNGKPFFKHSFISQALLSHQQVSLLQMANRVPKCSWVRRQLQKHSLYTSRLKEQKKRPQEGVKLLPFVPFNPERMIVGDKSS